MKHVLIVNNNMHIGGVQKALVNLLHEIHGDYEVTLLLFYAGGELCVEIPEDVQVITARSPFRYWGMTRHDAVGLKDRLARTFWAAATRLLGRGAVLRLAYPLQKKLGDYDAAVSYLHSGPLRTFYGGCNEFVLRCVRAKRKVTFLHCDFEKYTPRLCIICGYISSLTGSRPVHPGAGIRSCEPFPNWRIRRR